MNIELKELTFWETIGKSINIYMTFFIPLFIISLVSQVPLFVIDFFDISIKSFLFSTYIFPDFIDSVFYIIINTIFSSAMTGLVTLIISNIILDEKVQRTYITYKMTKYILPLAGLSFLTALIAGAGFLLLIIPGLIFSLAYILAPQIMVIENKGIKDSLKRSWNITKGFRFKILLFLVIYSLFTSIPIYIINITDIIPLMIKTIIKHSIHVLFSPVYSCLLVLVYFNIIIKKEGFNIEQMVLSMDGKADHL